MSSEKEKEAVGLRMPRDLFDQVEAARATQHQQRSPFLITLITLGLKEWRRQNQT